MGETKMNAQQYLAEAKEYNKNMVELRRALHACPERGFDLTHTLPRVEEELKKCGITPTRCGKAGLVATLGRGKGKTFLLRADMDALPVEEQTGLAFAATNGNMHACGHDMHAAMLLGAAALLKAHEGEICGSVKLMFQPAEEIFEGSSDMIEAGVLQNPQVDAAMMIHVMAGMSIPSGTVLVSAPGVSAPAADLFTITVQGKGCHGSMPEKGVDPILTAAHIVLAVQQIQTRELGVGERAVLTFGTFQGGNAANVIADSVTLRGSLRTFDEGVRDRCKQRLTEIATGVAKTMRAEAEVHFDSGCPTLYNDGELCNSAMKYMRELLGGNALSVADFKTQSGSGLAGSEDFAYVSRKVPSVMLALAAGEPSKGYAFPQHHPKADFDESVLPTGAAAYAYCAMRWLEEHSR
jgi:hippurate hydrolase